ncbi:MAG TPA: Gfo/Idh/MocA family oxidoreductase [Acidimicrobiales bacterium]|nr:Gfo/Idh/MocA family oxidoreductase [Acidimicrobiales bacterium]
MARLRFGLVGTGYWALHTHGTALASSPDAELVGVWGRDLAKVAGIAQHLGAKGYADYDELLGDVEAVAVAVPPDVQADLAARAARAGRHLLLEKPLALSVQKAEALVAAVDQAGVACLVFVTSRFRPEIDEWLRAASQAGPWHSAHLVHYASIFQAGNPYSTSQWRREHGALWDIGPHALGSVVPLLGPVRSVTARQGPTGSDTVHLLLGHSVGDHGKATGDEDALGPVSTVSLSLTMPQAATTSQLVLYGAQGVRLRPEGHFEAADALRNALRSLRHLVESGERRHPCDPWSALADVRVLSAARSSAASGATVSL